MIEIQSHTSFLNRICMRVRVPRDELVRCPVVNIELDRVSGMEGTLRKINVDPSVRVPEIIVGACASG